MRDLLEFDDAGAQDAEPAKGVTVGDIRAWFDEIERLREGLQDRDEAIRLIMQDISDMNRLMRGAQTTPTKQD